MLAAFAETALFHNFIDFVNFEVMWKNIWVVLCDTGSDSSNTSSAQTLIQIDKACRLGVSGNV